MLRQGAWFRITAAIGLMAVQSLWLPQSGFAQERRSANGDCAVPDDQSRDGSETNGENLSRKLDRCNGELRAPGVGDGELVQPAPPVGNTPVIRPDELPPGRNPSNNPGGG